METPRLEITGSIHGMAALRLLGASRLKKSLCELQWYVTQFVPRLLPVLRHSDLQSA